MLNFNSCIRHAVRNRPPAAQLFRLYARPVSTKPVSVKPVLSKGSTLAARRVSKTPSDIAKQSLEEAKYQKIKLAEELYVKNEVLLYTAPRHLTYLRLQIWAIFGVGGSFLAWFFGEKVYDVEKLREKGVKHPWPVALAELATATFVAFAMGFFLYRSTNHVQTVRIVKEADTVFLRLSIRSIFPGIKSHVAVRPFNLAISDRLVWPRSPPNWMLPRKLNESSASAVILSVIGNSLRAFPRFFWQIWNQGRRLIRSDGLMEMRVIGENKDKASAWSYSLDVDGAWLLHDKNGKQTMALYSMGMEDSVKSRLP